MLVWLVITEHSIPELLGSHQPDVEALQETLTKRSSLSFSANDFSVASTS